MQETDTKNEPIYFTDLEPDTRIKIGICPVVGRLSSKPSSHKAGWAYMLCNQLWHAGYPSASVINDDSTNWEDFDVILIEHGMEFKGNFNIFGGANDDLYKQVNRLFSKVRMYSLHHDMPCVGTLIEKRLNTGSDLFRTLGSRIDEAKEICKNIARVDLIEKTDKLCFGDSHSFSQYTPGFMCDRNDGLTLFGTLKRGISTYVPAGISSFRVYLGNIDIRHHLMRQKDPHSSLKSMMLDYELQLQDLGIEDIEVVQALPIEDVSRKLPKTGYYKDTPYFGTWEERTKLVNEFNELVVAMCGRNEWKTWQHPSCYKNALGELTFDVMEKPKSVHIAREFYRWDLVKDEENLKLEDTVKTAALF